MDNETLYDAREAAALIDRHYITTLNLIRKGHLRGFKKGGKWVVKASEIERFNREGNLDRGEGMDCDNV